MIPEFNNGKPYDGSYLIHRGAAADPIVVPWEGHSELQFLLDFVHRNGGSTAMWQFLYAIEAANPRSQVVIDIGIRLRWMSRNLTQGRGQ